jgi:hypothetical protein
LGAIFALLGQSLTRRVTRARTGKRLAIAFWEELSAVNFYGPPESPNFAGFSSQTLDSLFREVADSLPESMARDLMRYHWRMKYMEEMKSITIPTSGHVNTKFWAEAKELRDRLLTRTGLYGARSVVSVFARSRETCDRTLLMAPKHAA